MKCLKEPSARLANCEDDCDAAFFASRFKSIAILDEIALLEVCVSIDLNPLAAGITSRHGKARLSADVAPLFARLGTTAELWEQRLTQLKTMFDGRKWTGRFLATSGEILSAAAQRLGLHHLVNLAGRDHLAAPLKPAPSG